MFRARIVLVAGLLLIVAVPAARADPLTIYNDTNVTVTVRLDGGFPFIETVTLPPGTNTTRDVWRVAPNRRVTVFDHSVNMMQIDKQMFIGSGLKAITVRNFAGWEVVYGH
jgi:hypothetical protein